MLQVKSCKHTILHHFNAMHIIDSLSSLQQQKSLMFNPNALIGLAQKGMPRVVEVSLDSRREIDFQIKKVCEEFINNCVDGAVEPLTAFLIKVTITAMYR